MFIQSELMTFMSQRTIEETGLYEVHAEVLWSINKVGYRFFHTKHEPVPPCVSEAIEARVLYSLSGMRQRMTGHATLEAGTMVELEVWSNIETAADVISFEVFKI